MKKLSYILSWIKQDVDTFIFYFLSLPCSHSSHSLRLSTLGLSNSSLTRWKIAQSFLSGRQMLLIRVSFIGILISLYSVSPFFGTQQQLTHLLGNSSYLLLRKIPFFQNTTHRHTNLTLSCVSRLWD